MGAGATNEGPERWRRGAGAWFDKLTTSVRTLALTRPHPTLRVGLSHGRGGDLVLEADVRPTIRRPWGEIDLLAGGVVGEPCQVRFN